MTQFAELIAQVIQKNRAKRESTIKLTDEDRLSENLKLTTDIKPIFTLLSLDQELSNTRELKHLFNISDDNAQVINTTSLKLNLQNSEGNTVLHCITLAMKEESREEDVYMKLFDAVISSAYAWWCHFKHHQMPTDDKTKLLYKRKAVRYLINGIQNNENQSVLELAFQIGATKLVEKLMMMEGVTCTPRDANGLQKFDVQHIIPSTSYFSGEMSCLERLLSDPSNLTSKILDLPPLKAIENCYKHILGMIYILMTALHVAYMTILSYCSIEHLKNIRFMNDSMNDTILRNISANETVIENDPDQNQLALMIIMFSEPLFMIIVVAAFYFTSRKMRPHKKRNHGIKDTCFGSVSSNSTVLLMMPYLCLLVALFVHVAERYNTSALFYLTSLTVLYGWLMTFKFAYGVRNIHFSLQNIWQMLLRNMSRIIFVYAFFLLAFSLAIHAQFLAFDYAFKTYNSPLDTTFLLFNIMMGIGEFFDDKKDLESGFKDGEVIFIKFLYITYIIFVTLILLNFLIAMMNTSYSRINHEHPLSWRVETIQSGIKLDKRFSLTAPHICSYVYQHDHDIRKDPMFADTSRKKYWYVVVQHDKGHNSRRKDRKLDEMEERIVEKIQTADAKLESVEAKLDLLIEILAENSTIVATESTTAVTMDTRRVQQAWVETSSNKNKTQTWILETV